MAEENWTALKTQHALPAFHLHEPFHPEGEMNRGRRRRNIKNVER